MREFTYLVPKTRLLPGQAERTKENTVLLAYSREQLKSKLIVWSQLNYHYYVFDEPDPVAAFDAWFAAKPEDHRKFFEVVFGDVPQRLKIDLDKVASQDQFDACMRAIKKAWEVLAGTSTGVGKKGATPVLAPSMYLFRTSAEAYHILIDHVVPGVAEAKAFAESVVEQYSSERDDRCPVDLNVYARTQNFRIVGSSKVDSTFAKVLINASGVPTKHLLVCPPGLKV